MDEFIARVEIVRLCAADMIRWSIDNVRKSFLLVRRHALYITNLGLVSKRILVLHDSLKLNRSFVTRFLYWLFHLLDLLQFFLIK